MRRTQATVQVASIKSKSRHEQFWPNRGILVSCSSASNQCFTASQTGDSILFASASYSFLHNFFPPVLPLFLKLVLLQNPLTSRATVVDCSDRQNGAATPPPKPTPIPEPKLKPDVRPGKVSCQLLRHLRKARQRQQRFDNHAQ